MSQRREGTPGFCFCDWCLSAYLASWQEKTFWSKLIF